MDGIVRTAEARQICAGLFLAVQQQGKKCGLSGKQLACLVGVSRARWAQLANGKYNGVGAATFLSLAQTAERLESAFKYGLLPASPSAATQAWVNQQLK